MVDIFSAECTIEMELRLISATAIEHYVPKAIRLNVNVCLITTKK